MKSPATTIWANRRIKPSMMHGLTNYGYGVATPQFRGIPLNYGNNFFIGLDTDRIGTVRSAARMSNN